MESPKLTARQELFCLKYFELGKAKDAAIAAGYSPKTAPAIATHNIARPYIQARLQELRQKAEDESVMNVLERKQRLTEIARAKLTDFMELGQDGSWVNIGQETAQGGAIQEIHSRTEYDDDGANPTVHTSVKLHDPMKAIDLLNKMDKLYSEGAFIQNNMSRTINILVIDQETKDLIDRAGDRTKLLTIGHEDNQSIKSDPSGME